MKASKRIAQVKSQVTEEADALRARHGQTEWCCESCKSTFLGAIDATISFTEAAERLYKTNPEGSFERTMMAFETALGMFKLANIHLDELKIAIKSESKSPNHTTIPIPPKKEYLN